jgi:hypothetical protein
MFIFVFNSFNHSFLDIRKLDLKKAGNKIFFSSRKLGSKVLRNIVDECVLAFFALINIDGLIRLIKSANIFEWFLSKYRVVQFLEIGVISLHDILNFILAFSSQRKSYISQIT